jgi:hypothetical protein
MVFWLIGANAPIIKIYFKCILKKSKNMNKKFPVCIRTFYVQPSKFWCEKTFFVPCVKKTKKSYENRNFVALKIVFFTEVTKIIFFLQNLVSEHKISRCTLRIFFHNF